MTLGIDPAKFDALERLMWAGIWTAADPGLADEHGVSVELHPVSSLIWVSRRPQPSRRPG
jgi:hypothetical protein